MVSNDKWKGQNRAKGLESKFWATLTRFLKHPEAVKVKMRNPELHPLISWGYTG